MERAIAQQIIDALALKNARFAPHEYAATLGGLSFHFKDIIAEIAADLTPDRRQVFLRSLERRLENIQTN